MGKVLSLLAACILVASAAPALTPHPAAAQSLTLPCSVTAATPMQGQYSGPWHSDGDYHFAVFSTDLDLKVVIDGTLSLAISSDGHVSGTASGSVNAPIYDYGRQDVSSGYGTISGPVTGTITGTGAILTLTAPVILMHWGTFVGGGYTVDQNITMPDYTFSVGGGDCITSQGSIAETNFPPKWIVPDGTSMAPVMATGVGSATGTWSVTSADAGLYNQLSQQVDSFIASANAAVAEHPTYAVAQTQIVQPLAALVNSIAAHPTVSRCLLERLGAWAVSASISLYGTVDTRIYGGVVLPASAAGLLANIRMTTDTLRLAGDLGGACHVSDDGASDRLLASLVASIQSTASTDAPDTALLARELLLWKATAGQETVQSAINTGIHDDLARTTSPSTLLAVLRQAYVFGDDTDVSAMYRGLAATTHSVKAHTKKKKGKKGTTHKHKHKSGPTPRPTPRPTATPKPKTLEQVLTSGITAMSGKATGDAAPTFSWNAVPGTSGTSVRYVVTVMGPGSAGIAWAWTGTATTATYGDTGLPDLPGSASDGWTLPLPSGYHWTILALDGTRIVGLKLR